MVLHYNLPPLRVFRKAFVDFVTSRKLCIARCVCFQHVSVVVNYSQAQGLVFKKNFQMQQTREKVALREHKKSSTMVMSEISYEKLDSEWDHNCSREIYAEAYAEAKADE